MKLMNWKFDNVVILKRRNWRRMNLGKSFERQNFLTENIVKLMGIIYYLSHLLGVFIRIL